MSTRASLAGRERACALSTAISKKNNYSAKNLISRCSAVGTKRVANQHSVLFAACPQEHRSQGGSALACCQLQYRKKTEYLHYNYYRGVAQLVARLVRDQEAMGSNPVTSTTAGDFACKSQQKEDCFMSSFFCCFFFACRPLLS